MYSLTHIHLYTVFCNLNGCHCLQKLHIGYVKIYLGLYLYVTLIYEFR